MHNVLWSLSLFLLVNLLVGLWRALRGPTAADRLLTVQLFSTTSVAVLLLQARLEHSYSLRDIALVFALLGAITAVAFVRYAWSGDSGD